MGMAGSGKQLHVYPTKCSLCAVPYAAYFGFCAPPHHHDGTTVDGDRTLCQHCIELIATQSAVIRATKLPVIFKKTLCWNCVIIPSDVLASNCSNPKIDPLKGSRYFKQSASTSRYCIIVVYWIVYIKDLNLHIRFRSLHFYIVNGSSQKTRLFQ